MLLRASTASAEIVRRQIAELFEGLGTRELTGYTAAAIVRDFGTGTNGH
jgi:hypothetical protein